MVRYATWALAGALLASGAGAARAEGQELDVEVGQSVEVLVGYARGVICDDLSIIDADLHEKTADNNAFVVTGKAVGTTLCRVGTDALHVRYLFDVHVIPPRPKPEPRPEPQPPPKPPPPKPPPPGAGSGSGTGKARPKAPETSRGD